MTDSALRRVTAAALVVAPALLLVDNMLHPKEFTRGNEAQQLAEIADHYQRWQAAHAIGFVALVIFAAATAGLAVLLARSAPRAGLVGGALGIAGLIALGSVIAIDGYTWGILGEISARDDVDQHTVELTLRDMQESDWSLIYYTTPVAFIVGPIVLAVGVARERLAPVWAAAVLILGVLMTGTETAIVSNAYFIAGAAVLLAGGVAVAWGLVSPSPVA